MNPQLPMMFGAPQLAVGIFQPSGQLWSFNRGAQPRLWQDSDSARNCSHAAIKCFLQGRISSHIINEHGQAHVFMMYTLW